MVGGSNPSGRANFFFCGDPVAKIEIKPVFAPLSAIILLEPFRYVWNNLPSSLGGHIALVLSALFVGYLITALILTWIMTICWKLWKPS